MTETAEGKRTLHCALDISTWLTYITPADGAPPDSAGDLLALLLGGADLVADYGLPKGRWELREDGAVVDSGWLQVL